MNVNLKLKLYFFLFIRHFNSQYQQFSNKQIYYANRKLNETKQTIGTMQIIH